MAKVEQRHLDSVDAALRDYGIDPFLNLSMRLASLVADAEAHPNCSGCQQTLTVGQDTNYCLTACACLGAVWCEACWNTHIDRGGGQKSIRGDNGES